MLNYLWIIKYTIYKIAAFGELTCCASMNAYKPLTHYHTHIDTHTRTGDTILMSGSMIKLRI